MKVSISEDRILGYRALIPANIYRSVCHYFWSWEQQLGLFHDKVSLGNDVSSHANRCSGVHRSWPENHLSEILTSEETDLPEVLNIQVFGDETQ